MTQRYKSSTSRRKIMSSALFKAIQTLMVCQCYLPLRLSKPVAVKTILTVSLKWKRAS
ncbi:Uncharacterised protein [Vibrio cholerae]|nr:Uncharacterised protein [Vibrio cholerae]